MTDDFEIIELDCGSCDDGVVKVPASVEDEVVEPTCGDCMEYDPTLSRDMPPDSFVTCRICDEGNGWEDDDMEVEMEFDVFYHPACLAETEYDSLYDYIMDEEVEYNEQ